MTSCFGGSSYLPAYQATHRSTSRHSRVPSYLSNDHDAENANTSFTSTTSVQDRRRQLARRTLIEVLNEALELLHDDGESDFQHAVATQQ